MNIVKDLVKSQSKGKVKRQILLTALSVVLLSQAGLIYASSLIN
ncbi:MAG: hypothetical protein OCD00_04125 [Colwellia sp.]